MLWSKLKGRGRRQPVFRRQFAYESMIFDFYCPAAMLVVEVDGSTHWDEEKQAKDHARDRWLAGRGIGVLRVGAGAVYRSPGQVADGVVLRALEMIQRAGALPRPALSTTPSSGRGPPLPPTAGKEGCFRRAARAR